jgi:hypothetical protein
MQFQSVPGINVPKRGVYMSWCQAEEDKLEEEGKQTYQLAFSPRHFHLSD